MRDCCYRFCDSPCILYYFIYVIYFGLVVFGITLSVFGLLFFLESGIASIATAKMLCESNYTTQMDIICTKTWYYSSFAESLEKCLTIATFIFSSYLGIITLSFICVIISMCFITDKKSGYASF